ncbi:hypothetical protein [Streptomyces sp. NPDC048720]|uniref:hypothetical protein n=1 Tax=Streptomyces sp. NPDC048720 TaxID=3365588 RepID=UPI0037244F88
MNTEEVCEMIDAITAGETFVNNWVGETEGRFNLAIGDEGFAVHATEFGCNDPRTAREIAGALVAWANRKGDSITHDQIQGAVTLAAIRRNKEEGGPDV